MKSHEKGEAVPEIILTQEQAKILVEARENVILRDEAGTVRVVSEPGCAVALAKYHQDKMLGIEGDDGIPPEKVGFYLKSLMAERIRLGGGPLDEDYVEEFLKQLEKADAA